MRPRDKYDYQADKIYDNINLAIPEIETGPVLIGKEIDINPALVKKSKKGPTRVKRLP